MCEIIIDIIINVCSDAIFIGLLGIISWIIFQKVNRKELFEFYGLNKSKTIEIIVSNLKIKQYGAIGVDGKERSFTGSAGPFGELLIANKLKEAITLLFPLLSDQPGLLGNIFLTDIDITIMPSPDNLDIINQQTTIIVLGLPAYNSISLYLEQSHKSRITSTLGTTTLEQVITETVIDDPTLSSVAIIHSVETIIPSGEQEKSETDGYDENGIIQPEGTSINIEGLDSLTDLRCGFIERIVDIETGRTIFYIAGLSEASTIGSVKYLLYNWKRLYKKYGGDKEFVIISRLKDDGSVELVTERKY